MLPYSERIMTPTGSLEGSSRDMAQKFKEAEPPQQAPYDQSTAPDPSASISEILAGKGPLRIGRYVFLAHLGEGAMGVVLAAFDPELHRRVAIKLIHAHCRDDATRRQRMSREAQAMAMLSHPNVVTVYEVGEFAGQLFLTMEFVQGPNLRQWLASHRTGWREQLAVFLQAAQGLAAAHRAGLIHRDFKPDNVFVGEDGRVRVGDFGLARHDGADDEEMRQIRTRAQITEVNALARELTSPGAAPGTPAYMAPEQFAGSPTDGRTDQFSFCVALWEALYGSRPFADPTRTADNVWIMGKRRQPPSSSSVPGWVHAVLDRGLSLEPDDRYPTMEAMSAALQADPTRRRRMAAGVTVLGLVVAGGFGARSYRETQQIIACEAEGASIAEVWNEEVRAKLSDGLLATGASYATITAERSSQYFDAQAQAWRTARTEACLYARVRGEWGEDTLERSTWCLDERRMELEALVAEFSRANATSVQEAVNAAARLSPVDPCLDPHQLGLSPPLPPAGDRVQSVRGMLSRAEALRAAGKYKENLDAAQAALAASEELAWPPLTAAARLRHGHSLKVSGDFPAAEAAYEHAFFTAATAGALEVAADAACELIFIVGYKQARREDGLLWSRHADVVLSALGVESDSVRRSEALNNLAIVQHFHGALDLAKPLYEQALEIRERALGSDHPDVAISMGNLAALHAYTGSVDRALELQQRVLAIEEETLGPDHPVFATSLSNLGHTHFSSGALAEAIQVHERALAIRERALGPDHTDVAASLNNLAAAYGTSGGHEKAKAHLERALVILEKELGPEHPDVATALHNLAGVLESMGETTMATTQYERSLAIREKMLGPEHRDVGYSLNNLAELHYSIKDYHKAKALWARALAIWEKALGPDHPDIAVPLMGLARDAFARHQPAKAVALAERALRMIRADHESPQYIARCRFVLAQALWDAPAERGRDRDRALALAQQVRDTFRERNIKELADVEAFLAEHGGSP